MKVGVFFWGSSMDYKKQYNLLIEKAQVRGSPVGYREKHHIIPRCMGGSNEKENLVYLTAKEHYVAHHLLYNHYRTPQLAYAWFAMMLISDNQERQYTGRQYEMAKLAMSDAARQRALANNPMNDLVVREKVSLHLRSPAQRDRIRETANTFDVRKKKSVSVSRWLNSPAGKEFQVKRVSKMTGVPRSTETKQKCSVAQKGKPKPKVQCSRCGVYVDKGNLARYHKH